ncbi:MAG: hypothetical protein GVY05_03585 [Bacteroidetes bacterium]|nr:hypothetical protein [Bacteroidota bacterium]
MKYFKIKTLHQLCRSYHDKELTEQFRLAAIRDNNFRLLESLVLDRF